MLELFYTDSAGIKNSISYISDYYPNLMELLRHEGYEEWGDCRGRAWCATCHVSIQKASSLDVPDKDESHRIAQISNCSASSRLACQIRTDARMHKLNVLYLGDE